MKMDKQIARDSRLNIVVLGYIVRGPLGGLVWHHLQYVLGLRKLGHRVIFLEDSDNYESCFNPRTCVTGKNPDYGLLFAQQAFDSVGIGDCWGYYDAHTDSWHGPQANYAVDFCRTADLLLNVSAVNPLRNWFDPIDVKVLIDTDPVFTQIKHLADDVAHMRARQHTHFFTFGENFGLTGCGIPDDGLSWQPTRQPVVIDCWANDKGGSVSNNSFTSILQWDSYAEREHNGIHYGMKSRSFDLFIDLPTLTDAKLELAIGSDSAPRTKLQANGWSLKDPLVVTKTPQTYRDYIKNSKAEFSISKHGYVISNSGWFSERSANYLASGRPVVVQSTAFKSWMNTDAGVLSFSTTDEAIESIDEISGNYQYHCMAACDLAAEYFCHTKVLQNLIDNVFEYESHSLPQAVIS